MSKEPPFDVWDGEELGLTDDVEESMAEEVAMHVDPESEADADPTPRWSELTDSDEAEELDVPVTYFADEQPERAANGHSRTRARPGDEREVDLEELLERQHYAFPER